MRGKTLLGLKGTGVQVWKIPSIVAFKNYILVELIPTQAVREPFRLEPHVVHVPSPQVVNTSLAYDKFWNSSHSLDLANPEQPCTLPTHHSKATNSDASNTWFTHEFIRRSCTAEGIPSYKRTCIDSLPYPCLLQGDKSDGGLSKLGGELTVKFWGDKKERGISQNGEGILGGFLESSTTP
ncbi:hypothetical protein VNO77_04263 [Canavalia gladiata]|uniref:Uncharacterized protein n=1 Tax=Canavalia gladiata TaxID=3824 RepID=A0AAN9MWA7_CANGL